MPAGDTELELHTYPPDHWHMYESPERNLYIYLEEDDEEEPERILLKFYETGEAVEGAYIGTVGDGRAVKHLYWANVYEGARYDAARGLVRDPNSLSEVPTSGGSAPSDDTQGPSEDV